MKTIIIPDVHGQQRWKHWLASHKGIRRVIFLGDYFDTFYDITPYQQVQNFLEIMKLDEQYDEVYRFIGNHDLHYFDYIGDTGTSGYQPHGKVIIEEALREHGNRLAMAYSFKSGDKKILCSHAGITETWLEKHGFEWDMDVVDFVNDQWVYKPQSFCFEDYGRQSVDWSGDNVWQSPVWVRPRSLMSDSQKLKDNGYVQVVGHTRQKKILTNNEGYYFVDTMDGSQEHLIIEGDTITINEM